MRLHFGLLVATVALFGATGKCQADSWTYWTGPWTEPAKQMDSLQAAFGAAPQSKREQGSPTSYYDIAVENICNGAVTRLVDAWLTQFYANIRDRLVLINATVQFTVGTRHDIIDYKILERENTFDASQECNDLKVAGIRKIEKVKVIFKLKVVDEFDERIKSAINGVVEGGAEGGAARKLGPKVPKGGSIVTGVIVAGQAAWSYFSTKRVSKQDLKDLDRPEIISKEANIDEHVAGVGLVGNDQTEWITVSRTPRSELVSYDYSPDKIVAQINLVSVPPKSEWPPKPRWNEMLQTAGLDRPDWSHVNKIDRSCEIFRSQLTRSLQGNQDAVKLGLYAHFRVNSELITGDRAGRGCLNPSERDELRAKGYYFPSTAGS